MSNFAFDDVLGPLVVPRPLCLGLVCAVITDSSVVFRSFGESGDSSKALDEGATFDVGSITKVFTALLLVEMADRKDVALDDPLSQFLPEGSSVPSQDDRAITLLDLATHSSGLPRLPPNLTSSDAFNPQDPYAHFNVEQLLEGLEHAALEGRIGETVRYSNFGFEILAFALERAAGSPYADLLRERILEPLGMADSAIWREEVTGTRLVPGHGDMGQRVPFWSSPVPGDGGLVSTARDLARFVRANLDGDDLLVGVLRRAREVMRFEGPGSSVGLGWWISEDKPGVRYHWHNGGSAGYGSFMALEADRDAGIVLLANSHHAGMMDRAGIKVLDQLCGVA